MQRGKRFLLRLVPLFLALVLLAGCANQPDTTSGEQNGAESPAPLPAGFVPALNITGDVEQALRIDRETAAGFTWGEVDKEDVTLPCLELAELVQKAAPRAAAYDLLLVGTDGLASEISGDNLDGCHVAFSEEFSWECINENHPISSRIKMLQTVVVITREGTVDAGGVGFVAGEETRLMTAGQIWRQALTFSNEFEGTSEIGGNHVTVYTPRYRLPTAALLPEVESLCVVGKDGSMQYLRNGKETFVERAGNQLDFAFADGTIKKDIAGLMTDAPALCITETQRDALHILERGEPVLIIELDGWGWMMQQQADAGGHTPFLSALDRQQAIAVYPTISPVGLASILTGATPDAHGIHDRNTREFEGVDLFAQAAERGLKALYVEGETALIATSLQPTLSPDLGGLAGTDDEVFENARAAIQQQPDLLYVHFHGIDDIATDKGPYAAENFEKMAEVDGYVRQLVEAWNGKVIITADHGLHETEAGGTHGSFVAEDLLVPYVICDGGARNG